MPSTLRLLTVPLALAALLLVASTSSQAAPADPEFAPVAFEDEEFELEEEGGFELEECEAAEEEFEEGLLTAAEVDLSCEEEESEAQPPAKPRASKTRNKGRHRARKHKTCKHKSPARKRRCRRRGHHGGGFNSQARHPGVG